MDAQVSSSKKIKIHAIAKAMNADGIEISSRELLDLCPLIGFGHIKHHSNAVDPADAKELRRKALLRYRPKNEPAPVIARPAAPKKTAPAPPTKPKPRVVPSTTDVKPVAPPKPVAHRRGTHTPTPAPPPPTSRRRSRRGRPSDADVTRRTIIFKQPKREIKVKERPTHVTLDSPVTVRDLCDSIGIPANEIIKELMFEHDTRVSINGTIPDELVQIIGITHEVEVTINQPQTAEERLLESLPDDDPERMTPRPPVVAMLGHVDHGKTSILDRIRNANVADSESGGITQHIAAWQSHVGGHTITFVDTPGHEAFTAMRARGAKVTDIVVLVVAADDGVMPQTEEAINHAKAADVPIVVALNKMDKPDANPLRVMQQLSGFDLNAEEWGGATGVVKLSAETGEGIDDLLERIVLEAEMRELTADPTRDAVGSVIEGRMEPGRGAVTYIIVQKGTLRIGDVVVCGNAFGAVRAMYGTAGSTITEAGPAQPVGISGLDRVPEAGDMLFVVDSLEKARTVAEERGRQIQDNKLRPRIHITLENLYESLQAGRTQSLNMVLKADVQGSLDPLLGSLGQLGNDEVSVKIIHSGVGNVTTGDVLLAEASDAVVVAFRTMTEDKVTDLASTLGIEILNYDVIYHLTENVQASLEGMLAPEKVEEVLGRAIVRATFRISRFGVIAGCFVQDGKIQRGSSVRIIRDGETLHTGPMASLKREKNDTREVIAGRECGINIEGFDDIQTDDIIECFTTVSVKRTL
jgi:translation initiation factor IF-2